MPAFSLAPALSLFAAFRRVSPVRPLETFVRTTEERFRPRRLTPHVTAESRAETAVLARGTAGLHQRATILRETGRGRMPTIVLGGLVPNATEQVFLLRRFFLRTGDLYYFNYPPQGFSLELAYAQLDDLVAELAAQGERPVLFAVSFGAGLALEWLRRTRLAGRIAPIAGLVLVSPVACVEDVIAPGASKPRTLLGRALKPFLDDRPANEAMIEKSRVIFTRMFEAGAQNKASLRFLLTQPELIYLRDAVIGAIRGISNEGARERVQALRTMVAPTKYFSQALLPLTEAPVLVLFAESEEAVLDAASPTRFAFESAHRAYFPQGRVECVSVSPGGAPVQHASLIFHVFEFLKPLNGFYSRLRAPRVRTADAA